MDVSVIYNRFQIKFPLKYIRGFNEENNFCDFFSLYIIPLEEMIILSDFDIQKHKCTIQACCYCGTFDDSFILKRILCLTCHHQYCSLKCFENSNCVYEDVECICNVIFIHQWTFFFELDMDHVLTFFGILSHIRFEYQSISCRQIKEIGQQLFQDKYLFYQQLKKTQCLVLYKFQHPLYDIQLSKKYILPYLKLSF